MPTSQNSFTAVEALMGPCRTLFPKGDIAGYRAEAFDSPALRLTLKTLAAYRTGKRLTRHTDTLVWRRLVNDLAALDARSRRNGGVRHADGAEQIGVCSPIDVIGFRVTRFAQRHQIVFSVGLAHGFEKTIGNKVMTVESFATA